MLEVASIIIAYLLGSFPAAYIIARHQKGIDIREVGVRNMGGGNVIREVGKLPGFFAVIADIGKGALAVAIAGWLGVSLPWQLGAGAAVMFGHNYPVFLGFRGGKGIATVMGVFFLLSPFAMLCTTALIGLVLIVHRNFLVGVEVSSPFFLLFIWIFEGIGPMFYLGSFIFCFQLFRSRARLKEIAGLSADLSRMLKRS